MNLDENRGTASGRGGQKKRRALAADLWRFKAEKDRREAPEALRDVPIPRALKTPKILSLP